MEIHLKKNKAAEIMIPMIDSSAPASLKSGLTVTDTAYYKDGAGSWTALSIIDTFTEIGATGMYTIELTAGELNHDLIMIKCTASGAADSVVILRTFAVDVGDLVRSTTPANTLDIEAGGTVGLDFSNTNGTHPTVGTVTSVTNDVEITQAGADKVWSSVTRTLTSFGTLVNNIWVAATRTLTAGTKDTEIDRLLGLAKEDFFLDNIVHGEYGPTSARKRIYSNPASTGTDNDVIATYLVTFTYSSSLLVSEKQVKQ